tara:strand:- start:251 stop:553 length:303 start_codon:yes stop_codon:yes gene_type:complete
MDILDRLLKETEDQVSKNRIKINRFASKYNGVRKCFHTEEETDDLYEFLYDIANAFYMLESEVYFMYVHSKYDNQGKISKTMEEDFAIEITLQETINQKI